MKPDCERFRALLLDGLDEPLAPPEQQAFEAHLATCPDCVTSLRAHVALRTALGDLDRAEAREATPLSEDLVRRCVSAMTAARRGTSEPGAEGSARIA